MAVRAGNRSVRVLRHVRDLALLWRLWSLTARRLRVRNLPLGCLGVRDLARLNGLLRLGGIPLRLGGVRRLGHADRLVGVTVPRELVATWIVLTLRTARPGGR